MNPVRNRTDCKKSEKSKLRQASEDLPREDKILQKWKFEFKRSTVLLEKIP